MVDIKFVYSMVGLWKDEMKWRKKLLGDLSDGSSLFFFEVLVFMLVNLCYILLFGWI